MIHNTKLEPLMPAVAALFNYFIFSNIAFAAIALASTLFNVAAAPFLLKILPFLALSIAVYFQFRQKKQTETRALFTLLTPGEIMVGFKQRAEGKEWAPALKGNKIWWIAISILNFFVIGDYWSFLTNGYTYTWLELCLRIALCILFFGAMATIGNGRVTAFIGILLVISFDYGLTILGWLYSDAATVANGHFNITALIQLKSSLWASVNSAGLLYYLYHQNPHRFKETFRRIYRR